jgi:hypothetical protein
MSVALNRTKSRKDWNMNPAANFPAPSPLADPSFLSRLALEQSGWTAFAITLLGLCAFLLVGRRQRGSLAIRYLAGAIALAMGVWLLGRFVETGREAILAHTRALVFATAGTDVEELRRLLGADAVVVGGRLPGMDSKERIIRAASDMLGRQYALDAATIVEMQGEVLADGRGRTQVLVRARTKNEGVPGLSWWLIEWSRGEDGAWRASRIEPKAIQGLFSLSN